MKNIQINITHKKKTLSRHKEQRVRENYWKNIFHNEVLQRPTESNAAQQRTPPTTHRSHL